MKIPRFDSHAFVRRAKPVSPNTGISWQDFGSMQIHVRKQSGERRLPTPLWALNDALLRELLVVFMELRAGIKKSEGTLIERLARARTVVAAQRPRLGVTLDVLCEEYRQLNSGGGLRKPRVQEQARIGGEGFDELNARQDEAARRAELEMEIEGLDTYLRYTQNGGADVLAAVVYLYYRVGLDSVGVAIELGLKPPHVRQLLYRLNHTWNEKLSTANVSPQEQRAEPLFAFLDL